MHASVPAPSAVSTLNPVEDVRAQTPVGRLTLPVAAAARIHQGLAGRVSLQVKLRPPGAVRVAVAPASDWVGVVTLR